VVFLTIGRVLAGLFAAEASAKTRTDLPCRAFCTFLMVPTSTSSLFRFVSMARALTKERAIRLPDLVLTKSWPAMETLTGVEVLATGVVVVAVQHQYFKVHGQARHTDLPDQLLAFIVADEGDAIHVDFLRLVQDQFLVLRDHRSLWNPLDRSWCHGHGSSLGGNVAWCDPGVAAPTSLGGGRCRMMRHGGRRRLGTFRNHCQLPMQALHCGWNDSLCCLSCCSRA
jgi:hypothetical protein